MLATGRDDLNYFYSINIVVMFKNYEKIKQINMNIVFTG